MVRFSLSIGLLASVLVVGPAPSFAEAAPAPNLPRQTPMLKPRFAHVIPKHIKRREFHANGTHHEHTHTTQDESKTTPKPDDPLTDLGIPGVSISAGLGGISFGDGGQSDSSSGITSRASDTDRDHDTHHDSITSKASHTTRSDDGSGSGIGLSVGGNGVGVSLGLGGGDSSSKSQSAARSNTDSQSGSGSGSSASGSSNPATTNSADGGDGPGGLLSQVGAGATSLFNAATSAVGAGTSIVGGVLPHPSDGAGGQTPSSPTGQNTPSSPTDTQTPSAPSQTNTGGINPFGPVTSALNQLTSDLGAGVSQFTSDLGGILTHTVVPLQSTPPAQPSGGSNPTQTPPGDGPTLTPPGIGPALSTLLNTIVNPLTTSGGLLGPPATTSGPGLLNPLTSSGGLLNPLTSSGGLLNPLTSSGGLLNPLTSSGGLLNPDTTNPVTVPVSVPTSIPLIPQQTTQVTSQPSVPDTTSPANTQAQTNTPVETAQPVTTSAPVNTPAPDTTHVPETTAAPATSAPATSAPPAPTSLPATGSDTQTQLYMPSSLVLDTATQTSNSPEATASAASTGISSAIPHVIPPPGSNGVLPQQPADTTLIQIGFQYQLNYPFVLDHSGAIYQIFDILPHGIAFGLDIDPQNVTMQSLQPYDTTRLLGFITTVALAYIPTGNVQNLTVEVPNVGSELYKNTNATRKALMSVIDPNFPVVAGKGLGVDGTGPNGPVATNTVVDQNPLDNNNSNGGSVKGTSVGIGIGVVAGAAVYGAAMFFVAKRYKKRKARHSRSSSMLDTSSMVQNGNEQATGATAALMGHSQDGSNNSYGTGQRNPSRNSGHSGSSRGRDISAPVMAENSLGWN